DSVKSSPDSIPRRSTLAPRDVAAIVSGTYQDIFAVLGMHREPASGGLVVRAFLPWAGAVTLVDRVANTEVAQLQRVHDGGLFELEDPYRFPSTLEDGDLYLFNEGTAEHAYRWLGAHPTTLLGVAGVLFAVWAPAAHRVAVVGDFNGWDGRQHGMRRHPASG